ncbi:MAG: nucleotide sugar dehydrogenase [Pelagibacteraceae bacterium]|nr:nucleotide sugar dehydrogenase [Pelagibacteraceae bacterium]
MNIGFIGMGKLGLPVALAIESRGHSVIGYDPSDQVKEIIKTKKLKYQEIYAQEYLDKSNISIKSIKEVVEHSEIIFVPIQTPHYEKYEGSTRIPDDRVDFDYTYLKNGIKDLSDEIEKHGKDKIVIIISTVLPGTVRQEIKPLLGRHTKLCYNPFFIAMGTTIKDFLRPEIILFGVDDKKASEKSKKFYRTINHAPFYETTIENAELIKVVYNTFIGTKISFVNTVMEMCHSLPNTNVDDVTNALKMCDDRIISDRYFSGGMGDGGGCHPRDNIALSWLSNKLDLSFNWFDNIMKQRENQTDWLADLIEQHANNMKICILGKSFKPETNITTGSPSILLKNILKERGLDVFHWDPYVDDYNIVLDENPCCYFIGTKHNDFVNFPYEADSVIIDPWRYIPNIANCTVIRIGDNIND